MQTPTMNEPARRQGRPVFWILAAVGIVAAALLCMGFFLRDFYVRTASLAPGTAVRPIGLAAGLGMSQTISIFIGGGFAVTGVVVSLKQRRWWLAMVALMVVGLTWIPSMISQRSFDYVLSLRQLVLQP